MVKLIAWNIGRREEAWRSLLDSDADIALLQEAAEPPSDVAGKLQVDPGPWRTAGTGLNRPWRTAVVQLSNRITLEWLHAKSIEEAHPGDFAVSRVGALSAAIVTESSREPFLIASMYAPWEKPHRATKSGWIFADGSAHRLISDLSALAGQQAGHRIVAAGDLNILYRYGERRERLLGIPLRHSIQQDGSAGAVVHRPTGSIGPARGPLARRTADYKQQRSNVLHVSPDTSHSHAATGLCVRLKWSGRTCSRDSVQCS